MGQLMYIEQKQVSQYHPNKWDYMPVAEVQAVHTINPLISLKCYLKEILDHHWSRLQKVGRSDVEGAG